MDNKRKKLAYKTVFDVDILEQIETKQKFHLAIRQLYEKGFSLDEIRKFIGEVFPVELKGVSNVKNAIDEFYRDIEVEEMFKGATTKKLS